MWGQLHDTDTSMQFYTLSTKFYKKKVPPGGFSLGSDIFLIHDKTNNVRQLNGDVFLWGKIPQIY